MAYIGQPLNAGNLAVQTGTGDGADTTPIATLDYSVGSSESLAIYLDGVKQAVSTYTASGTTLTFTTAPPNGVGIEVVFLALPISLPTPGDNTVGLAQLTAGTDGELYTFDTNGDPAFVATGTAGQVLTSGGAGVAPTFAAGGGAWNFIATTVASTSATLDLTGMDATYDTYAVIYADVVPADDAVYIQLLLGDSGGIDTGASDYTYHFQDLLPSSASYIAAVSTGAAFIRTAGASGNQAGEGTGGICYISSPSDGTTKTMITGHQALTGTTGLLQGGTYIGLRTATIVCDRIQLKFSAGNIATGRMSLYGIAHA